MSDAFSSSWIVFSYKNFRLFFFARFLGVAGYQMLNVVLGQYVFELTKRPLALGLIGLFIFLPKAALSLFGGHIADRYNRRIVLVICRLLLCSFVIAMVLLIHFQLIRVWMIYGLLILVGGTIAFDGPSSQSLLPQLVKMEHFPKAATWHSSAFQIAMVAGPLGAGALYAVFHGPQFPLSVLAGMLFLSAALVALIRVSKRQEKVASAETGDFFAGIRYIFKHRILLGITSLDLFAVLLGGAVALLPVYANDIFNIGAKGLGYLRAAPAIGAALTALTMAHLPPIRRAGRTMLLCVAIFGLATICFGISKNLYLTLTCLFILGSADIVSVVIRSVLVQTQTPPEMRGRVSAVNLVFIGASNELGEFESGLTAWLFGTVPAVVIGGIGTLLVVGLYSWRFPELRKMGRLV